MSATDEVLAANKDYAAKFDGGGLAVAPARKLAILACMDSRLSVEQVLGLKTGDAHIIRNAGGVVTEDVLRSLIISHHLLNTQEFIVINHTDCGMATFTDEQLYNQLEEKTGDFCRCPHHLSYLQGCRAQRAAADRAPQKPSLRTQYPGARLRIRRKIRAPRRSHRGTSALIATNCLTISTLGRGAYALFSAVAKARISY